MIVVSVLTAIVICGSTKLLGRQAAFEVVSVPY
jgi:hypothetical protein